MIILKKLEKLCHVSFFKFDKKNVKYQQQQKRSSLAVFEKNAWLDVFGFLIIYMSLIKLEKTNMHLTFPGFF